MLIGAPGDALFGVNGAAYLFSATTGALLQTFNDPTPTEYNRYGASVSVSGDYVLIGAPDDSTNGSLIGQAHLFSATTGLLLQTFDDPTPTGSDFFGTSVSVSGDNVLIGAPHDATNGPFVGQAHLFSATTGALLQTFNDPAPTDADGFGRSLSVSGDNVLIGAWVDDTNGIDVGQAHLFSATTGALLQTFNDPTPTDRGWFGLSVSVSGDNVLIGANGDDTIGPFVGQAHLFSATTGALLQTFNDPAPTDADGFGRSLSVSGDNVLIGASGDDTNGQNVGQAHLFTDTTSPFSWPIGRRNDPTAGHFGPCADQRVDPKDPEGCYWLSDTAEVYATIWRDASPFQNRDLRNGNPPGRYHLGADYNLGGGGDDKDKMVFPTAPGKVVYARNNVCGYGKVLFIRHDTSFGIYTSMYAHVDWLPPALGGKPVKDQLVTPDVPIARVSNGAWDAVCAGDDTGDWPFHLHFEIREGDDASISRAYTPSQVSIGPQGQIDPNEFIATH